MKTKINYHAINWVDGMKLTASHFATSDFHMKDTVRDASSVALNSYNYGLLPPLEGMEDSIKLTVNNHANSHIEIVLESCNAVTANGTRLVYIPELYHDEHPRLSVSASSMEENTRNSFFVVVNINSFKRIPIGTPDPEEVPLRHPHSYPEISLKLMPRAQVNSNYIGAFQFLLGELIWENSTFIWDSNYIPPCTSLCSHSKLIGFWEQTIQKLNRLKNHCITVIRNNSFGRPNNNKLAENTCSISMVILNFISDYMFEFRQMSKEQSPIYFVNNISILANRMNTALIQIPDNEKEILLQYYHEWENVRPVDFESVLGELMEINYLHSDIVLSLQAIKGFLDTLLLLWGKLSQLEYIGQRKDNIVVRSIEEVSAESSNRWSLLD